MNKKQTMLEVAKEELKIKPVVTGQLDKRIMDDGYRPEYCDALIEFFNRPPYKIEVTDKNKTVFVPNELPLMASFATKIGISQVRIREWIKKYPEFKEAVECARDMMETILVVNSLLGNYNPAASTFALKNLLGWSDRVKTETVTELNINSVIQKVEEINRTKGFLDE
jgi:hypothetical protein